MSVNLNGCLGAIVMLLYVLQLGWEEPIGILQFKQMFMVHAILLGVIHNGLKFCQMVHTIWSLCGFLLF